MVPGYLEVVMGSMYSGKSEELMRRLKRAKIGGKKVMVFKPSIDKRYDENDVVSHDGTRIEATAVLSAKEILYKADCEVVGIDEVQFFDKDIVKVIDTLTSQGYRVIVAGLDMYASGEPWEPMGTLACKAKYLTKLHAVCTECGNDAYISHRTSDSTTNKESTVKVGSFGEYIALCEKCRSKH